MCRGGNRCPAECCDPRRGSARSRRLHRPSGPSVHPPPLQIRVCPVPLHSVWLESNTEELVPPRTALRREARAEVVSWKRSNSSFDRGHGEIAQDRVVRLAELEIDPAQLESYKVALQEEIETSI